MAPESAGPGRAVSVVIPTYNSGAGLAATVEAVRSFFRERSIDGEVIVADDGSTDGSAAAITQDGDVRVLHLPHRGKGAALRAGMTAASGRIRAFTDADLPYGLEPLPRAITYIEERRFHAVIGDRTLPGSTYQGAGPLRTAISQLASLAFRTLVTGGIHDTQCGFKVFRGDVAAEIFRLARIDGFAIDVELIYLILKHRLDLKRIPVRLQGNAQSSVRVLRDSARAFVDIARIRWNLSRGHYRSPMLSQLLEQELGDDLAQAEETASRARMDGRP